MTADLHSVLLEAITARQERAKAAARFGAEWIASFYSELDEWRVRTKGGREGVADVVAHDDVMEQVAKFMAGEDPAAVQRQCARDLRMLQRHAEDEECLMRDCLDMEEMAEASLPGLRCARTVTERGTGGRSVTGCTPRPPR